MIIYSIGKRIKNFFAVKIMKFNQPQSQSAKFESVLRESKKKTYYPNGQLKSEITYLGNDIHGVSYFYYENGRVKVKENYDHGLLDGISRSYYKSGKLENEMLFKMGKLQKKQHYDQHGTLVK